MELDEAYEITQALLMELQMAVESQWGATQVDRHRREVFNTVLRAVREHSPHDPVLKGLQELSAEPGDHLTHLDFQKLVTQLADRLA